MMCEQTWVGDDDDNEVHSSLRLSLRGNEVI